MPLSLKTPSETQVEVTRSFDSPVALVWRALSEPELVRRWLLGPPGWTMPVCQSDFRVGGAYEYGWRSAEGEQEFGFVGEFREIEPNSRIVHTERTPGVTPEGSETLVTITFREGAGGTNLVTAIEYPSSEGRDAALASGMEAGMESSYRKLDELLAGLC